MKNIQELKKALLNIILSMQTGTEYTDDFLINFNETNIQAIFEQIVESCDLTDQPLLRYLLEFVKELHSNQSTLPTDLPIFFRNLQTLCFDLEGEESLYAELTTQRYAIPGLKETYTVLATEIATSLLEPLTISQNTSADEIAAIVTNLMPAPQIKEPLVAHSATHDDTKSASCETRLTIVPSQYTLFHNEEKKTDDVITSEPLQTRPFQQLQRRHLIHPIDSQSAFFSLGFSSLYVFGQNIIKLLEEDDSDESSKQHHSLGYDDYG